MVDSRDFAVLKGINLPFPFLQPLWTDHFASFAFDVRVPNALIDGETKAGTSEVSYKLTVTVHGLVAIKCGFTGHGQADNTCVQALVVRGFDLLKDLTAQERCASGEFARKAQTSCHRVVCAPKVATCVCVCVYNK